MAIHWTHTRTGAEPAQSGRRARHRFAGFAVHRRRRLEKEVLEGTPFDAGTPGDHHGPPSRAPSSRRTNHGSRCCWRRIPPAHRGARQPHLHSCLIRVSPECAANSECHKQHGRNQRDDHLPRGGGYPSRMIAQPLPIARAIRTIADARALRDVHPFERHEAEHTNKPHRQSRQRRKPQYQQVAGTRSSCRKAHQIAIGADRRVLDSDRPTPAARRRRPVRPYVEAACLRRPAARRAQKRD